MTVPRGASRGKALEHCYSLPWRCVISSWLIRRVWMRAARIIHNKSLSQ